MSESMPEGKTRAGSTIPSWDSKRDSTPRGVGTPASEPVPDIQQPVEAITFTSDMKPDLEFHMGLRIPTSERGQGTPLAPPSMETSSWVTMQDTMRGGPTNSISTILPPHSPLFQVISGPMRSSSTVVSRLSPATALRTDDGKRT